MSQPEPTWDHYRSFLAVLEDGSLSHAARSLGLTQPTLARHIEQLEAALGGVALFARSPRGLTPTDAAVALAPHAQAMASAAAALVRAASGSAEALEGTVRITASVVIGSEVLPGILRELHAKHPKLSFELALSNETSDLLRRDADVAIRMTRPKQAALVAKRVGDVMLGLHAHRDYLKRHGAPKSLEDCAKHALIGYDRDANAKQLARLLGVAVTREMFVYRTDNEIASLNAIRSGCGIGICQNGLGARSGLTRILPKAVSVPLETWIVMHEDQRGNARMRVVFDHLVGAMNAYAREG
ncbi:MAG: LysR family transcriptional regulator [Terricaulis sp.]